MGGHYLDPLGGLGKLLEQIKGSVLDLGFTLSCQNLLFCSFPINSILGFIVRLYKKSRFQ